MEYFAALYALDLAVRGARWVAGKTKTKKDDNLVDKAEQVVEALKATPQLLDIVRDILNRK
jgi:uncharacterized membrane protein YfbV (UPF0208 family)